MFKATVSPPLNSDPQPTGPVVWTITSPPTTPSLPTPTCSGTGGDTEQMTGNGTGSNSVTCTFTLANNAPTGAYSASASYTGNGNYYPSATASPTTISVNKASPTLTFSTNGSPQPGATFTVKVTVNGNGTVTPTGPIGLTVTGPPGSAPTCGPGSTFALNGGSAQCVVSLPAAAPTGVYTVAVNYGGDTAYNGVTGSKAVTVSLPPAGINIQTSGGPADNKPDGAASGGDTIIYTYNQVMAPGSIMTGLIQNQPTNVTAVFSRQTGATSLNIQCTGFRCTNPNLGTVSLGDTASSHYVGLFGSISLNATMVLTTNAIGQSVVTITLTQASGGIAAVPGATSLVWTPSAGATNSATPPVACATTPVNEAGAPEANF